eukprot:1576726-Rhodomonas_salina.2
MTKYNPFLGAAPIRFAENLRVSEARENCIIARLITECAGKRGDSFTGRAERRASKQEGMAVEGIVNWYCIGTTVRIYTVHKSCNIVHNY